MADIPAFPDSCRVELGHRQEVLRFLEAMRRPVSEWTFTNLFLFRGVHGYRLSRHGGLLLVSGKGYDGAPYDFVPWGAGDVEEAARALCRKRVAEGVRPEFFPVPPEMVGTTFGPGAWEAVPDPDQADYVYLVSDLSELPGKKFHKRRNRLAKFLREYGGRYAYAPMDDGHAEGCLALARRWCDARCSPERPSTFPETEAACEAIEHRRELGLTGGVSLLDGEVAAFCLGEPLDGDTFVMHFEKSRPDMEGLAQAISRDFCAHAIPGYRYVNREQDLGDPGLRQAKEGSHPVFKVEKFRVRPLAGAPRGAA